MNSEIDLVNTEAQALLRAQRFGTLATASAKHDQWPFASVMPYGFMADGAPVIYIAGIAEHTRNLKANPRASLFVHPDIPANEDAQTHARLTLMVEAEHVSKDATDDAWARYVCRLPDAQGYTKAHDFELWRLKPVRARYIGGFGRIYWLEAAAFVLEPERDALVDAAAGIVEHMNDDHRDAMSLLCEVHFNETPSAVEMTGVDQYGFDVRTDRYRRRFEFSEPATPDSVRRLMVELVHQARAAQSAPAT